MAQSSVPELELHDPLEQADHLVGISINPTLPSPPRSTTGPSQSTPMDFGDFDKTVTLTKPRSPLAFAFDEDTGKALTDDAYDTLQAELARIVKTILGLAWTHAVHDKPNGPPFKLTEKHVTIAIFFTLQEHASRELKKHLTRKRLAHIAGAFFVAAVDMCFEMLSAGKLPESVRQGVAFGTLVVTASIFFFLRDD